MHITAYAPGTDWGVKGSEAADLEVWLDNGPHFDVMMFMGERPFTYTICIGPVSVGTHEVTIAFQPQKSAPTARQAVVTEFAADVIDAADSHYQVLAHAPMLYGRDVNGHSDVPLLMWFQEQDIIGGKHRIVYTAMWSNEDGGTSSLGLITTWGHTTDIEWIYDLLLGPDGEIEKEYIQAPAHAKLPFGGRRIGAHPILRVATTNNNVVDEGESPFFFGFDPAFRLPAGATREEMMDRHPWSYRITAVELAREGKLRPALLPTVSDREKLLNKRQIADLRNYVYIDFSATVIYGRIGFAVKRKNDPLWYGWYPDLNLNGITRSGVNRVAVEVPAGTRWPDIEAVRVCTQAEKAGENYSVLLLGIQKVMMLQDDYTPGPAILTWSGRQMLTPAEATMDLQILCAEHSTN